MNVLIVYNHIRRWIANDIDLISKYHNVTTCYYKDYGKYTKDLVKRADIVYIWFASKHGIKPVYYANKYNKKIITVAGGYDVSTIKGYGLASTMKTRWIPKYILKNSDIILAFSNYAKQEIQSLIGNKKEIIVNFGVDTDKFYPEGAKKPLVLTVGYLDKVSWKRKGIDKFLQAASLIPDYEFAIVGKIDDNVMEKTKNAPPNAKFIGYIPDEKLLQYYQEAKVYAQLSEHEGFCSALAEAMLCNCIPVVTNKGALPEVVGDTGFYASDTVKPIVDALNAPESLGIKARKRVLNSFSLDRREKELVKIIEEI